MKAKKLTGQEIAALAPPLPATTAFEPTKGKAPPTVQFNVRVHRDTAAVLGQMSEREGGLRNVLLRLLIADGQPIMERPKPRRKWK